MILEDTEEDSTGETEPEVLHCFTKQQGVMDISMTTISQPGEAEPLGSLH